LSFWILCDEKVRKADLLSTIKKMPNTWDFFDGIHGEIFREALGSKRHGFLKVKNFVGCWCMDKQREHRNLRNSFRYWNDLCSRIAKVSEGLQFGVKHTINYQKVVL
jgi:hypothetical protein